MSPDDDLELAHAHSSDHRAELEASTECGCFYCTRMFPPSEIVEWIDDGKTAICPRCAIDSVLGSASGWPMTLEFLARMKRRWFGPI